MLIDSVQAGQPGRDRVSLATPAILEEPLAGRTVTGRPTDLGDDLAWVRAASGRSEPPRPTALTDRLMVAPSDGVLLAAAVLMSKTCLAHNAA